MTTRNQQLIENLDKAFVSPLKSTVLAVDEVTIVIAPSDLVAVCRQLRDDDNFKFEQLIDCCGVDYSEYGCVEWTTNESTSTGFSRGVEGGSNARLSFGDAPKYVSHEFPRFAAVYHLLSITNNLRLRVRVFAESEDVPVIPSVISIWSSADWYEREAFDLYGILFDGHPDLRRILTDYGFIGHPFRKDFPLIGNVEVTYDAEKGRVVYQPVSIEPRTLVPRVIREDNRYSADLKDRANDG